MYITLADFYCKWGILTNWARKQNIQIGGGGRGGNELELRHGCLDGKNYDISWLVVFTTLVDLDLTWGV